MIHFIKFKGLIVEFNILRGLIGEINANRQLKNTNNSQPLKSIRSHVNQLEIGGPGLVRREKCHLDISFVLSIVWSQSYQCGSGIGTP